MNFCYCYLTWCAVYKYHVYVLLSESQLFYIVCEVCYIYIASLLISAFPALGSGFDEDDGYSAGSYATLFLGVYQISALDLLVQ